MNSVITSGNLSLSPASPAFAFDLGGKLGELTRHEITHFCDLTHCFMCVVAVALNLRR